MSLIGEMRELGMNVDEGLERVMGDGALYEMMLGMFVTTVRDHPVSPEDFDGDSLDGLIQRVHMLKGVAGNLALTPLFSGYSQALTLLRAGDAAGARAKYERLLPTQQAVIGRIERCQAENRV